MAAKYALLPLHLRFPPPPFFVAVVQESETCWAAVGVGHTEVEAAGAAVCLFHAGELSAVLMELQRAVISALRG